MLLFYLFSTVSQLVKVFSILIPGFQCAKNSPFGFCLIKWFQRTLSLMVPTVVQIHSPYLRIIKRPLLAPSLKNAHPPKVYNVEIKCSLSLTVFVGISCLYFSVENYSEILYMKCETVIFNFLTFKHVKTRTEEAVSYLSKLGRNLGNTYIAKALLYHCNEDRSKFTQKTDLH